MVMSMTPEVKDASGREPQISSTGCKMSGKSGLPLPQTTGETHTDSDQSSQDW